MSDIGDQIQRGSEGPEWAHPLHCYTPQKCRELEREVERLRAEKRRLENECDALRDESSRATTSVARITDRLDYMRSRVAPLERSLEEFQSLATSRLIDIQSMEAEVERLTQERDDALKALQTQKHLSRGVLDTLRAEVERLKALLRECLPLTYANEKLHWDIRAALGEDGKIKIPSTSGPAATTQAECQAALGEGE